MKTNIFRFNFLSAKKVSLGVLTLTFAVLGSAGSVIGSTSKADASKNVTPVSAVQSKAPESSRKANTSFPGATTWPEDSFVAPISHQTLPSKAFFKSNSTELTASAIHTLQGEASLILRLDPHARMLIIGHTDSQGTKTYNDWLSLKRARVVEKWLRAHGFAKNQIKSIGVGFSEPVVQDRDSNGNLIQGAAQANRRVVIELLS